MPRSELDSLQATLNSAIDTIRQELSTAAYPDLSSLSIEPHPLDDPAQVPSRNLFEAQSTAIAALARLQILIQNPYKRAAEQIYSVYDAACLDIVVRIGLIDVLSDAPDPRRGLHVQELQAKLDVDQSKIAIILRLLAAKGWFHETSEGVFAVTRPSLQLRKGHNAWKNVLSPGKPRIAASLFDMITHPQWKYSKSSKETAYQLAFQTDLLMFDHVYLQPELSKIFADSIRSLGDEFSPGILSDYPWSKLDGRTIVDCGGGQGSLTILLVPKLPKSLFVLQDYAGPLSLAKTNLQTSVPDAWEKGRITLEEHDFFAPQPQTGGDRVFLFRWVLHNWGDEKAVEILSNAARAGGKGSKVLIVEFVIVPGAIKDESTVNSGGSSNNNNNKIQQAISVPAYIPADFGQVSTVAQDLSIHMMAVLNARERTLAEYESLITRAGLTLVGVYNTRSPLSVIETQVV